MDKVQNAFDEVMKERIQFNHYVLNTKRAGNILKKSDATNILNKLKELSNAIAKCRITDFSSI